MPLPALAQEVVDQRAPVVATSGRVEFQRDDGQWRPLVAGRSASVGPLMATRAASSLTLAFGELQLVLGELSLFRLLESVFPDAEAGSTATTSVVAVELIAGSAPPRLPAEVRVVTPLATVSGRGGELIVDGDRLVVIRGTAVALNTLGHRRTVGPGRRLRLVANAEMPQLAITGVIPSASTEPASDESTATSP